MLPAADNPGSNHHGWPPLHAPAASRVHAYVLHSGSRLLEVPLSVKSRHGSRPGIPPKVMHGAWLPWHRAQCCTPAWLSLIAAGHPDVAWGQHGRLEVSRPTAGGWGAYIVSSGVPMSKRSASQGARSRAHMQPTSKAPTQGDSCRTVVCWLDSISSIQHQHVTARDTK
jgi:hypothetical protein